MSEPDDPGSIPAQSVQYAIGAEVAGPDGTLGKLIWVVVDPVAQRLTHLVVEPPHRPGAARLAPVELVEEAGDPVRLRCDEEHFARLEAAEDTRFLPDAGAPFGYGMGQAMAWPYYGLGGAGLGVGAVPQPLVYDRVPLGEVQVRRGDFVQASDGPVGSVQGLVIDPSDQHVTHVLLQEGHLWGRKQVAIPITQVDRSDDGGGLCVSLTKDEIRDLPPVDLTS